MPRRDLEFHKNIFINCPFDPDYKQMLNALVFVILDCGFQPRIATERDDAGESRMRKIKELIAQSRFSIHDISRMEPLKKNDLPRFNMPFELGLDFGCRDFGGGLLSQKRCLILEKEEFRYRRVLSDISGNDIKAHENKPEKLVRQVRNWIQTQGDRRISSFTVIWLRFNEFYAEFKHMCEKYQYSNEDIEDMPLMEYIFFIKEWLQENKKNKST